MARKNRDVVVLIGTGGTISGTSVDAADNIGYTAGQVSMADLAAGLRVAARDPFVVQTEQIAQVDSKDMDFDVWRALALRCMHHLQRRGVRGVVVTHGTDTLEETAYFLERVLQDAGLPDRPIVLTGAMRPATSPAPDGPQNLRDAVSVAVQSDRGGVLVAFAGVVHGAMALQKVYTYRQDAFTSGEGGPLGFVEEGAVRWLHPPGSRTAAAQIARKQPRLLELLRSGAAFPRVEIVHSTVGADGFMVQALLDRGAAAQDPVRGIVVAATGNGTVHRNLLPALDLARQAGVTVWRATRCVFGHVLDGGRQSFPDAAGLTPTKARVALMLDLMTAP